MAFSPDYKAGYVMLMNAESNMINSTTAEFWERYFKQADEKRAAEAKTATVAP